MVASTVLHSCHMRPRPARQLTIFFFVYILAAWLGSKLSLAPHLGVTLWPVSGLYMGALVRLGARDLRPWIAVATLADMTASILLFGFPIGVAVFVSAGNSLEAWGGAAMLRRWYGGRFHLRTTRDGMAFVVMAGCIAPLGSMVLGGTFVGLHTGTPILDSWRLWWSGDAVGVILVAPAVICLGPRTWRTLRNASAADFGEIAALMAMTVVLGYVCLAQSHPFAFLMLPLVIWAGLRHGIMAGSLVSLLIVGQTLAYTAHGMGPFAANLSMVDAQLALQALGIACAVAGLAIALSVAEIRRMHERADRNLALKTEELRSHEVQLATALAELQLVDVRKDNFLSVLAHELLNPVGALINGHALLDQDMPKEQHLAVRAMMDRQISLLTMLSADLMDLARVKAGKVRLEFEAVSILQVATAAADSVRDKFERKVQVLATEFPDTDLEVRGDSKRLTQVVVNLLSNASRHCPEGTQVRIRAVARGDVVAIEIADNGPGIAQERISHIFNLYEQVDRDASEGLGLGLALSHQLIALHNGNLRVSSELAVGTVFVIELPRLTQR